MEELTVKIAQAGKEDVEALLNAVLRRYEALYPDWEINVITLDKKEDRNRQLDEIIAMLEKMKKY